MENLTEQEVRAFVGPNADYYLKKWQLALDGRGQPRGFNWAAFFLSTPWLIYRKMYKVAFILLGITLLESFVEEALFIGILGQPTPPPIVGTLVSYVTAGVCGVYGNSWYLSHVKNAAAQIRSQKLQDETYVKMLTKQGGTNFGVSLGLAVIFIGLSFVAVAYC